MVMQKKRHLLFDLDGTLVDSADSVLGTLAHVLHLHSIVPLLDIGPSLIGPSIQDLLSMLTGIESSSKIESLHSEYLDNYNAVGFGLARPYASIADTLTKLSNSRLKLWIVTNKCSNSTRKIVDHLQWNHLFSGVYSVDHENPSINAKNKVISQVLMDNKIEPHRAVYIGDRHEDLLASSDSGIEFIGVSWGYGDWTQTTYKGNICSSPANLLHLLQG